MLLATMPADCRCGGEFLFHFRPHLLGRSPRKAVEGLRATHCTAAATFQGVGDICVPFHLSLKKRKRVFLMIGGAWILVVPRAGARSWGQTMKETSMGVSPVHACGPSPDPAAEDPSVSSVSSTSCKAPGVSLPGPESHFSCQGHG